MIKLNYKKTRGMLTLFLGALFVASAFIFNSNTAQMQTGANTIAFDRYDNETNRTNIYVMNADGSSETELGKGFDPSWSANGTKIAYAEGTSEQYDIWTMNADGSEKTRLTENYRSFSPAWSPDGSRIAFVSDHEGGGYHVYVINADGTNQQRINVTASEVTQEFAPAWSPDGLQVIFLAQKVVNGLGRNDYYATNGAGLGATTQLTYLNALLDRIPAAVSPDGSRLVFEYQHDLQAYLLDGSNQLVNLTDGSGGSTDKDADYAPGGSKIIFSRAGILSVMNADGSNIESLGIEGSNADWNPTAIIESPTPTPTVTPVPQISADIAVQANASTSNVNVGQNVTYTASVSNGGANTANGVKLESRFSSLAIASIQASQGSCALVGGGIDCELGSLGVNASATVTIVASPMTAGSISNQFTASASETDPNSQNNSATVNITAVGGNGNCPQQLGSSVQVVSRRWIRLGIVDRDLLTMVVRNTSGRDLDPRLIGVFDNLPSDVTIDPLTRRGYTQCAAPLNSPYVVGSAGRSSVWRPGQTITLQILFRNPQRRNPITFTNRFFSGNVNP